MATLQHHGTSLYYEDRGEGPAVLLTHGYSATSGMWRGQVEAFSDACRVVTWDLPGHGRSASPDALSEYAEDVVVDKMAALLDTCGVERAVVGGLSLGGYLSLGFHLKYPQRVRGLLLSDTGPGYRNTEARERWNRAAESRALQFESKGLEALGAGAEVRISRHRSAEGLARAARGTLRQFDGRVIESLPEISVPTLVLVGEDDLPFRTASAYMAAKIPGATLVVLEGAGHAANIDQPEAFNSAVRRFLSSMA